MVMQCWRVTPPGAISRGQWAIHGTRMPPSVRSIFPPTSGQLSEKRSPPLSLVKTTSVSSSSPWRRRACITQPMPSSMWWIIRWYTATLPPCRWNRLRLTSGASAASSRVSHGQCGAV